MTKPHLWPSGLVAIRDNASIQQTKTQRPSRIVGLNYWHGFWLLKNSSRSLALDNRNATRTASKFFRDELFCLLKAVESFLAGIHPTQRLFTHRLHNVVGEEFAPLSSLTLRALSSEIGTCVTHTVTTVNLNRLGRIADRALTVSPLVIAQ